MSRTFSKKQSLAYGTFVDLEAGSGSGVGVEDQYDAQADEGYDMAGDCDEKEDDEEFDTDEDAHDAAAARTGPLGKRPRGKGGLLGGVNDDVTTTTTDNNVLTTTDTTTSNTPDWVYTYLAPVLIGVIALPVVGILFIMICWPAVSKCLPK